MTTRSCRFFSVLLLAGVLAGVTGCDAVKSLFQGEPSPQERAQEAYARAEELMSQGQLEQAEAAYRAAYAADPKLGGAALGLALVYRNRGEEGRALLQLQQARMLLPDDPAPPALMGDVLMNQGRYQRAARSYETAMRLAEGDAELRRRFARALIRAGELEEAEYQVERLLRDEPGNPAFEALEGLLLAAEGETRRARNILEDAARSSVGPEAPAALGWFLLREGEPAGAIRALRQSVEKGGDFADRRLLAEALIESGDGAAAVEVTGTLTRERPLDPLAHAMHARALVASGDHDAALKAANEAIRLDPKLAPALLARGAALEARGNLEGAIESYRAAAEQAPEMTDSYRQLAAVYRKLDRPLDAIGALERLVAVDPHDRRGAEVLLEMYVESPAHVEEGLRLVDRLLKDDPGDPALGRYKRQLQRRAAEQPGRSSRGSRGGSRGPVIIRGG